MQGAQGGLLPQGLEGPELQSHWEGVFLKPLPPGLQLAWVLRRPAVGLQGWEERLCALALAGSLPGRWDLSFFFFFFLVSKRQFDGTMRKLPRACRP